MQAKARWIDEFRFVDDSIDFLMLGCKAKERLQRGAFAAQRIGRGGKRRRNMIAHAA